MQLNASSAQTELDSNENTKETASVGHNCAVISKFIKSLTRILLSTCWCVSFRTNDTINENKILPMVDAPIDYDILEVKPDRRIRVIRRLTSNVHNCFLYNERKNDTFIDDQKEYWFENAAPNRMQILRRSLKLRKSLLKNRILNKFEPQKSPRIPGVPPRKNLRVPLSSLSPNPFLNRKMIATQAVMDDFPIDLDTIDAPTNPSVFLENKETTDKNGDRSIVCEAFEDISEMIISVTAETTERLEDEGNLSISNTSSLKQASASSSNVSVSDISLCLIKVPDSGESSTNEQGQRADLDESDSKKGECQANISVDKPSFVPNGTLQSPQPLIFFIHGIGSSASVWKSQIDHFFNMGFQVVALDLLGHGFSSTPDCAKHYTFNAIFKDVQVVFDHYVPLERKVVIISHAYGCSLAVALSKTRPDNVTSLILVAGGGPTPPLPTNANRSRRILEMFLLPPFRRQRHASNRCRWWNPRMATKAEVPVYVLSHILNGQRWVEGDFSFHRRVSIPTLLVYGLRDNVVSLVEMCEMERTMPKSFLELIPCAGHEVMIDAPHAFNVMAAKFIAKYHHQK